MRMTCEQSWLRRFAPADRGCARSLFSFNVIGRLADAFGFLVPGPKAFEAGAKYLLARGYR